MTPSSVTMKASIQRKPRFCIHRIRNTSSAVMMHADLERNAEQQIEPDRGADHLGEVGGADRDLGQHPQRPRHRAREGVAAGLRQIAAGADAEPRAQRLQQDRHQVGQQRDGQQRVAELRAARERGRPVARVHVADGDQVARAEKGDAASATSTRSGASRWSRTPRTATARRARAASRGPRRLAARDPGGDFDCGNVVMRQSCTACLQITLLRIICNCRLRNQTAAAGSQFVVRQLHPTIAMSRRSNRSAMERAGRWRAERMQRPVGRSDIGYFSSRGLPFAGSWPNLLLVRKRSGRTRPASPRLPRQAASSLSDSVKTRPPASIQVSPSAALKVFRSDSAAVLVALQAHAAAARHLRHLVEREDHHLAVLADRGDQFALDHAHAHAPRRAA